MRTKLVKRHWCDFCNKAMWGTVPITRKEDFMRLRLMWLQLLLVHAFGAQIQCFSCQPALRRL